MGPSAHGARRLGNFKRGQLNQNKTDITTPTWTQTRHKPLAGKPGRSPAFGGLDPLGNAPSLKLWRASWGETDVDSVAETRTHNAVNELTARTIGQDPQISLTYNDAGHAWGAGSAGAGARAGYSDAAGAYA